jgi:hypothetical protein
MIGIPEICAQCGKLAYAGETVTILAKEYEELLRFRNQREASYDKSLSAFRLASRSRIARDPELARFILQCAETLLIGEVEAACIKTFGKERAPSRSSIYRFLDTVRPQTAKG